MKKITFLFLLCLVHIHLVAQDDVTIGKYKKFKSGVLGGEVTNLQKGEVELAKESFNESQKINQDFKEAREALDKLIKK